MSIVVAIWLDGLRPGDAVNDADESIGFEDSHPCHPELAGNRSSSFPPITNNESALGRINGSKPKVDRQPNIELLVRLVGSDTVSKPKRASTTVLDPLDGFVVCSR